MPNYFNISYLSSITTFTYYNNFIFRYSLQIMSDCKKNWKLAQPLRGILFVKALCKTKSQRNWIQEQSEGNFCWNFTKKIQQIAAISNNIRGEFLTQPAVLELWVNMHNENTKKTNFYITQCVCQKWIFWTKQMKGLPVFILTQMVVGFKLERLILIPLLRYYEISN